MENIIIHNAAENNLKNIDVKIPLGEFVCITGVEGAKLIVTYQGAHAARPADEVDVDSFIGVKSHRAKGKRITTLNVASIEELEPLRFPVEEEENPENSNSQEDIVDPDDGKSQQDIKDELIGQLHLFD